MNIVPDKTGSTPNYWSTWGVQVDVCKSDGSDWIEWNAPTRQLNEKLVFDQPGCASHFYPRVRNDWYFLFDVGWDFAGDVDAEHERWHFGSIVPDAGKFPSFVGTPAERLCQLNDKIKALGWRGLALWISPQAVGDGHDGYDMPDIEREAYWHERARWSQQAGIEYWKVDVGYHSGNEDYCRMLTRIAREEAPGLLLEHAPMGGPFNDVPVPWENKDCLWAGRYRSPNGICERAIKFAGFSDVLRIYDVSSQLGIPTSLDRIAEMLAHGQVEPGARGLINCQDEVYIAAGLGCAIGTGRYPPLPGHNGMRDTYKDYLHRDDEIIRALRWQRLGPAFGIHENVTTLSSTVLTDNWLFKAGDTWADWVIGKEISQGAPAIIARGLPLPDVRTTEAPPYVVAARYPNNVTSIATLPRTNSKNGRQQPLADISLNVGDGDGPIGVFGEYVSLTLNLDTPLGGRRLWGQDLAGDTALDVTEQVDCTERQIVLSGKLLKQIGLSAASPNDRSAPGLVLQIV